MIQMHELNEYQIICCCDCGIIGRQKLTFLFAHCISAQIPLCPTQPCSAARDSSLSASCFHPLYFCRSKKPQKGP